MASSKMTTFSMKSKGYYLRRYGPPQFTVPLRRDSHRSVLKTMLREMFNVNRYTIVHAAKLYYRWYFMQRSPDIQKLPNSKEIIANTFAAFRDLTERLKGTTLVRKYRKLLRVKRHRKLMNPKLRIQNNMENHPAMSTNHNEVTPKSANNILESLNLDMNADDLFNLYPNADFIDIIPLRILLAPDTAYVVDGFDVDSSYIVMPKVDINRVLPENGVPLHEMNSILETNGYRLDFDRSYNAFPNCNTILGIPVTEVIYPESAIFYDPEERMESDDQENLCTDLLQLEPLEFSSRSV